jgi:hypothetical protein
MGDSKELGKELEQAQILLIQGEAVGSITTMRIMDEMYSDLKYVIIRKQVDDPFIQEEIKRISEGKPSEFQVGDFDSLYFQKMMCVPDDLEIKAIILKESHETPYSIHPGSTKMQWRSQKLLTPQAKKQGLNFFKRKFTPVLRHSRIQAHLSN